ncbi:kinesin-domain-containing protein [Cylindrobasidium torrendii FP15055 ss-10]|uniref:Kinesin-like protein n=1 Tax=Cylindrobasidium torrendii FP15055 ss-10 TaxID=1314674 RepID=A0A0D7BEX1_9AGAR|nr:kinesin-domain-containing protein [Cylindrobasidium torrendii FP15055 ss-10]
MSRSGSSNSGANISSILGSTHKRYKAPVSSEARASRLAPVPASPGRPKTPSGRSTTPIPEERGISMMDVSNVDPEEVLVDFENVEADVSGEIDPSWFKSSSTTDDKVMVSVRVRPTNKPVAWDVSADAHTLTLDPLFAKNDQAQKFDFDAILTGSPNKPIYSTVAQSHVSAAMEGYNAVVFAYGQTASGKTYTLSGDDEEPGIIPRAMKDVFRHIKHNESREYLLRCSYLEIYNETIQDLLAPVGSAPVGLQGGNGGDIVLSPLREEVVTSLKGVHEVLHRGESHRRTACTDWNARSSRSHSVFRLVVESRERLSGVTRPQTPGGSGRHTPGGGRQTPGPRLQAIGGRSVQTSVLSLIDLAGSEKATSDKERTREGKYINTSLLTLGSVIGTLSDNAAKGKSDHVPFRNSKLTRMLQPSLSGNARISVICTINPEAGAITESTSTLLFAKRIKSVKLNAQKKEVVDTDALLERYRQEIEDLKTRLAEKEEVLADNSPRKLSRRLSAREKIDESKAMKDLNNRIQQLTKLILTSNTVEEGGESRPGSPMKLDFDMEPYQLQQELLAARVQLESQARQILALEAAMPPAQNIEGTEAELRKMVQDEIQKRTEKETWAEQLVKELEKEKKLRIKLEEERKALVSFVSMVDSLGLGGLSQAAGQLTPTSSPVRNKRDHDEGPKLPSLLDQVPEEDWSILGDLSFELEMKAKAMDGKSPLRRGILGELKQNLTSS